MKYTTRKEENFRETLTSVIRTINSNMYNDCQFEKMYFFQITQEEFRKSVPLNEDTVVARDIHDNSMAFGGWTIKMHKNLDEKPKEEKLIDLESITSIPSLDVNKKSLWIEPTTMKLSRMSDIDSNSYYIIRNLISYALIEFYTKYIDFHIYLPGDIYFILPKIISAKVIYTRLGMKKILIIYDPMSILEEFHGYILIKIESLDPVEDMTRLYNLIIMEELTYGDEKKKMVLFVFKNIEDMDQLKYFFKNMMSRPPANKHKERNMLTNMVKSMNPSNQDCGLTGDAEKSRLLINPKLSLHYGVGEGEDIVDGPQQQSRDDQEPSTSLSRDGQGVPPQTSPKPPSGTSPRPPRTPTSEDTERRQDTSTLTSTKPPRTPTSEDTGRRQDPPSGTSPRRLLINPKLSLHYGVGEGEDIVDGPQQQSRDDQEPSTSLSRDGQGVPPQTSPKPPRTPTSEDTGRRQDPPSGTSPRVILLLILQINTFYLIMIMNDYIFYYYAFII
eukprot:GHVL01007088.1.p1 GENE.GHVL01007088.1~~GHVL01007088.1.p1  ORF type:complete len:566 (-),score=111.05 GHVL01007088.1:246-1745(-)